MKIYLGIKNQECEYLTTIVGNDDLTDYFEYDFKDKIANSHLRMITY